MPRFPAVRRGRVAACAVLLVLGAFAIPALAASTCATWGGSSTAGTLAQAIHDNACVSIAAGTFDIPSYITVPAGHTVTGAGASATVLRAAGPWNANGYEGVLNVLHDGDAVQISGLTLDANQLATDGVAARGMSIDSTVIEGARCNGVGIAGANVSVTNSTITGNGASCPTEPPGTGLYITGNNLPSRTIAPVVTGNTIEGNSGPGVDIDGASGGTVSNNTVAGNGSWAGISVFGGQNWTIKGNTVTQPSNATVHPYQPLCRPGSPSGGPGTAGILLCQTTDNSDGLATFYNSVTQNTTSGYYGILLIGRYAQDLPSRNAISGNSTSGSTVGCADEQPAGTAASNSWTGNDCGGPAPRHFPDSPCFAGGGTYLLRISPAQQVIARGGAITLSARLLQDGRECGSGLALRLYARGAGVTAYHLSRQLVTDGRGLGRTTYSGVRADFRWYVVSAPANDAVRSPGGLVQAR